MEFISGMIFAILEGISRCMTVVVSTIDRKGKRITICLDLYTMDVDLGAVGYHGAIGYVTLEGVEYQFIPIFREIDLTRSEYTHIGQLSHSDFSKLRIEIRNLLSL